MALFFAKWLGGGAFRAVIVENNVFTHSLGDGGSWHEGASFVVPGGSGGRTR